MHWINKYIFHPISTQHVSLVNWAYKNRQQILNGFKASQIET